MIFRYLFLPHATKVLFLALSVTFCFSFCLSLTYLGNGWTDLHQIYREDLFGPSLVWVLMSRSRSAGTTNADSSPLTVHCKACSVRCYDVIQQQTTPFHHRWGWQGDGSARWRRLACGLFGKTSLALVLSEFLFYSIILFTVVNFYQSQLVQ